MSTNDYIKIGLAAAIVILLGVTVVTPMMTSSLDNIVISKDNTTARYNTTENANYSIEIVNQEVATLNVNGETWIIGETIGYFRAYSDKFLIGWSSEDSAFVFTDIETNTNSNMSNGDKITIVNNKWTITGSINKTGTTSISIVSDPSGAYGEYIGREFKLTKTSDIIVFLKSANSFHLNKIDYQGNITKEYTNISYVGGVPTQTTPLEYVVTYTEIPDNPHTVNVSSVSNGDSGARFFFAPLKYLEMDKTAPAYAIASLTPLIYMAVVVAGVISVLYLRRE